MAAGSTYSPIATHTIPSDTSSYTFSSIPGTYTDLVLVANYRDTRSDTYSYPNIRFNSDTSTNYSFTILTGDGTSASSSRSSNATAITFYEMAGNGAAADVYSPAIIQIQNYANSTTYKTCLIRDSYSGGTMGAQAGLWRSTAAITSITIGTAFGIKAGSSFTLYGITAA
jgi:hypothetical protein